MILVSSNVLANKNEKAVERKSEVVKQGGLFNHYGTVKPRPTLTDDDGNTTDKLDCLGLGTKKCSWPGGDPAAGNIVYVPNLDNYTDANNKNFILNYVINQVDILSNYSGFVVLPDGQTFSWISTTNTEFITITYN